MNERIDSYVRFAVNSKAFRSIDASIDRNQIGGMSAVVRSGNLGTEVYNMLNFNYLFLAIDRDDIDAIRQAIR